MIVLHWVTAFCVVIAWLLGEDGPQILRDPPTWHFVFGLAVLVLVVPRLVARLAGGAPAFDPRGSPLLRLAARTGHAVLYAFLIAMPLSGWYAASALGIPLRIFGVALPALASPVPDPPGLIADLHSNGGSSVFLVLAGGHALMALYHHLVLKDDTLRRMTPAWVSAVRIGSPKGG